MTFVKHLPLRSNNILNSSRPFYLTIHPAENNLPKNCEDNVYLYTQQCDLRPFQNFSFIVTVYTNKTAFYNEQNPFLNHRQEMCTVNGVFASKLLWRLVNCVNIVQRCPRWTEVKSQ